MRKSNFEVIEDHVAVNGDCWEWQGANWNGYGKVRRGGKTLWAHRWVWETLVGQIPDGLQVDHLCLKRSCVNPDHLEIVSRFENIRRSKGTPTNNRCRRGHYGHIAENVNGYRVCGECQRINLRRSRVNAKLS